MMKYIKVALWMIGFCIGWSGAAEPPMDSLNQPASSLDQPAGSLDQPTNSLYQMAATLTTQTGQNARLDLYRGYPVIISMFYGTCPAACPLLITAIQTYEAKLDEPARARLRVLMISFDAARDGPPRLRELAQLHGVAAARWSFSSAAERDARKIAALLGIQYRRLPDGEFDHSLLITLLDNEGRVLASTVNLYDDKVFLAALRAATVETRAAQK